MRLLLFLVIANFFILTVSCVQVYDESAEEPPCLCSDSFCLCRSQENYDDDLPHMFGLGQSKRALGPASNLLRVGNFRIDYSQVDPILRKLLLSKKKQNSNSFYNLLRYCGNNCELVGPLNQIARGCVCRKRKEHEEDEDEEHDCKFSKSSSPGGDGNSMKFLIQKWAKNHVVKASVVQEDSAEEQDSGETGRPPSRTRQEGRFSISDSDCSLSLSEKHRARVPVGSSVRSKSKSKQLSKKLSLLQSKIESESEEFQKSLGYRPSMADKMKCEEISHLMQEKTKIKLELKDLNEETPRKKMTWRSAEQARDTILTSLDSLRCSAGRPYNLDKMTGEQMADERRDMQSLLSEFEKMYSTNSSKKEKELMADLYERLRSVKRLCRRQSDLVPIPEHGSLDLSLASTTTTRKTSQEEDEEEEEEEEEEADLVRYKPNNMETEEEKWHQMSLAELNSTLKKLKECKKDFKRNISEIEIRAKFDEDEVSLTEVYVEYKATKCKIKLIKALLDKQTI